MTVKELIEHLQQYPQDLPVIVPQYSEQRLLENDDLMVVDECHARGDGWIQNKRPDMPTRKYLRIG